MREELQNKIFEAGPILYSLRELPVTECLMCWGICCPDEWFEPLLELTKTLEDYNRKHKEHPVLATQVKMKFKELRFYVRFDPENNDFARAEIDRYECSLFFKNQVNHEKRTSK